jgi:hypothetical protein
MNTGEGLPDHVRQFSGSSGSERISRTRPVGLAYGCTAEPDTLERKIQLPNTLQNRWILRHSSASPSAAPRATLGIWYTQQLEISRLLGLRSK